MLATYTRHRVIKYSVTTYSSFHQTAKISYIYSFKKATVTKFSFTKTPNLNIYYMYTSFNSCQAFKYSNIPQHVQHLQEHPYAFLTPRFSNSHHHLPALISIQACLSIRLHQHFKFCLDESSNCQLLLLIENRIDDTTG